MRATLRQIFIFRQVPAGAESSAATGWAIDAERKAWCGAHKRSG
jgi:hypothetical protein